MDLGRGPSARRSDIRRYREHLQRRHRPDDTVSRFDISGLAYWPRSIPADVRQSATIEDHICWPGALCRKTMDGRVRAAIACYWLAAWCWCATRVAAARGGGGCRPCCLPLPLGRAQHAVARAGRPRPGPGGDGESAAGRDGHDGRACQKFCVCCTWPRHIAMNTNTKRQSTNTHIGTATTPTTAARRAPPGSAA